MHPFLQSDGPIAFAHRGGALEAEENTAEAFARAEALGYTHIETDVHLSRDGVVVVHHDNDAGRMFGDGRLIRDMDWVEIATLSTAGGAAMPRLDAVLADFPGLRFNIELKAPGVAGPLAEVFRRAKALDRVCVGAFDPAHTAEIRGILGERLCWSPAHVGVARVWARGWGLPLAAGGFDALQVPMRFGALAVVTPRFVRGAHRLGCHVHVWTVDDGAEMDRLLDMGVDGIMTDRPTLLKEVMQRRGDWPA